MRILLNITRFVFPLLLAATGVLLAEIKTPIGQYHAKYAALSIAGAVIGVVLTVWLVYWLDRSTAELLKSITPK